MSDEKQNLNDLLNVDGSVQNIIAELNKKLEAFGPLDQMTRQTIYNKGFELLAELTDQWSKVANNIATLYKHQKVLETKPPSEEKEKIGYALAKTMESYIKVSEDMGKMTRRLTPLLNKAAKPYNSNFRDFPAVLKERLETPLISDNDAEKAGKAFDEAFQKYLDATKDIDKKYS